MTTHLKLIYKTNSNQVLKHTTLCQMILFCEKHIQVAMNQTNKNSSPGPDITPEHVTPECVLNGGKNLVAAALNMLMQTSYQLGYFPKPWKKSEQNLSKETRKKVVFMCPAHTDQYLSLIYLVKSLKERYYKKQSIHWQKIISLKEKCILIPKKQCSPSPTFTYRTNV